MSFIIVTIIILNELKYKDSGKWLIKNLLSDKFNKRLKSLNLFAAMRKKSNNSFIQFNFKMADLETYIKLKV